MSGTRSKASRKRDRPSLCESQRAKRCYCGGKNRSKACEMAVSCDGYGRCLRGCSSNNNCAETRDKEADTREKVCTRLGAGVINHIKGELDVKRLLNATPPSRMVSREQLVRHEYLCFPSATEMDLAIVFGQKSFFPCK